MKSMKKKLLIAGTCLLLLLTSCGPAADSGVDSSNPGTGSSSAEELPPPTSSLSVYFGDAFGDDYLDTAIRLFKANNPDVELEVTSITFEDTTAAEKLPAQLAAGSGPDLVISNTGEFSDNYKTMDSGVFCDLEPFLQKDEDYNPEDYVTGVFDAGIYRGKRYFIPLSYYFPAIDTTEEALANAGVGEAELADYGSLMKAAADYSEKHPESTAFYKQKLGATILFPFSGVDFLDYENKTVNVNTDEFRTVMEAYKGIYEEDWVKGVQKEYHYTGDEVISLREGKHLFTSYLYGTIQNVCEDYEALSDQYTPRILPLKTVDGKVCALLNGYGAIRSNSENKSNAYEFLKVMLSQEVQSKMWLYYPVRKSAVSTLVRKYEMDDVQTVGTRTTTTLVLNNMSLEEMQATIDLMTSVDEAGFYSEPCLMVFEGMEPYFKGESDYESCLQKLENDLAIYISE